MPKIGMEPVRRRQIIAATMTCLSREGISRTSFGRIAREAGIAPALIQHYFHDKETLLLETFRSSYREFTRDMRRRLALAQSPAERVVALLEAMIAPSVLTAESVRTWLVIYGQLRDYPLLQRIEHAFDRRYVASLSHALQRLGRARPEAHEIALQLAIFIDGLWQNAANPVTFTPERARAMLYAMLTRLLPGHDFPLPQDDHGHREAEDAALSPPAQQFLRDNLPVGEMTVSRRSAGPLREEFHKLARIEGRAAAKEHQVSLSRQAMNGIETLMVRPRGHRAGAPAQLFYLFGGGYVSGEPETDLTISAGLSARLGVTLAAPTYRLAPEAPWPAAPKDALAAYRGQIAAGCAPFAVVGESAGGGLALAMLQEARDAGLPLPAAVVLLSPWVDLAHDLPLANDGWDPTVTRRYLRDAARLYAGEAGDSASPALSPLRGDLHGLPPVMITTGSRDILREQAHALAKGLQQAGVPVLLRDWPGLWHVFEFYRVLPEAAQSLDEIAAFLRPHLHRPPEP